MFTDWGQRKWKVGKLIQQFTTPQNAHTVCYDILNSSLYEIALVDTSPHPCGSSLDQKFTHSRQRGRGSNQDNRFGSQCISRHSTQFPQSLFGL